jgi:putative copper export protein
VGLAVTAAAGIVVQGAVAGSFGLSDALSTDVIRSVLETRYGHAWALAILGGLVLAALAVVAARGARVAEMAAVVVAVLCACVPTFVGHAHVTGGWAKVADLVHIQAAGVWVGGLAAVVAALALERVSRWQLASTAVPRFSRTAVVAVAALIVAGTISGYLEIRAWRGLWDTHYGQLLLIKLALVVPLLALGALQNRFAVPKLRSEQATPVERRRFVQRGVAELALMLAVIGVTAVLVAEPPARASVAPKGPVALDTALGPFELNLVVDPASTGPNTIHVYLLDAAGRPANVAEAQVAASLPSRRIGPLRFEAHPLAPGTSPSTARSSRSRATGSSGSPRAVASSSSSRRRSRSRFERTPHDEDRQAHGRRDRLRARGRARRGSARHGQPARRARRQLRALRRPRPERARERRHDRGQRQAARWSERRGVPGEARLEADGDDGQARQAGHRRRRDRDRSRRDRHVERRLDRSG